MSDHFPLAEPRATHPKPLGMALPRPWSSQWLIHRLVPRGDPDKHDNGVDDLLDKLSTFESTSQTVQRAHQVSELLCRFRLDFQVLLLAELNEVQCNREDDPRWTVI